MPFQKGQSGNPRGHIPEAQSLRNILRRHPVKDKRALVRLAYRLALDGDVRWAEWIAKHSGEGADMAAELPDGSHIRRIVIEDIRYGDRSAAVAAAEPADALESGRGDVTVQLSQRTAADLGPD